MACDDGHVSKLGGGETVLACVAYEELRPVGVAASLVHVDGLDATSVLAGLAGVLAAGGEGVLFLDSLTVAGFNVISLPAVTRLTGLPAVVVYTYRPSLERLEAPLRQHFPDAELRLRVLSPISGARLVATRRGDLYLIAWGIGYGEARDLVELYQVYSRVPEPLRVAHRVASEMSRALGL
mgnify:CR=1 FL=1